ncbi:MAG: DUF4070 domain-containing protein [Bacteroidales bacterium]|nr:DUF4070 domain-containing protein [Bacteroidales bacterium]
MKILMVYPKYPDTYWSFTHALRFISKKAAVPPLGLITVAAMLPPEWEKKLIDMNISALKSSDLQWADYVFISAMYIQKESVSEVINRCKANHVKIVAGGPLFTQEHQNYPQIDHFILNEAEITMPEFLADLFSEHEPDRVYSTTDYAEMKSSPVPEFNLLKVKDYAFMSMQFSRGCPYACDFCEITSLLGHKVRMKTPGQIISEMDALYKLNWRGPVSIVDDNFTGNKKVIKTHLLPAMKKWMHQHHYPFTFNIQASIDLSDDPELLHMLTETGFSSAFIGIETPLEESLLECKKIQNHNRNLLESVKTIQRSGIQVSGGFIVGFDSDTPDIFQQQIDFIQKSGIVAAMVGLLNAPKNTMLYKRLESENRLISEATGNNTDSSMNFIPKMNRDTLLEGYHKIIENIYAVKPYYERTRQLLRNYQRKHVSQKKMELSYIGAFVKSIGIIGIANQGRREFWKFMAWTLFRHPTLIIEAFTCVVYGYHFRVVFGLTKSKINVPG